MAYLWILIAAVLATPPAHFPARPAAACPAVAMPAERPAPESTAGDTASAPGAAEAPGSAQPPAADAPAKAPAGEVYLNDRFGYALRRPRDWSFKFEPGVDVTITPPRGDTEIQVVARSFFDIRLQQVPEGPLTLDLRAAARSGADPFEAARRCLDPALRAYLQLFWLDTYVAWHANAAAEEYAGFQIESRRALQLAGHGGVELVYTLEGKRRPGTQKIKTIIVAYDERVCQLSYLARQDRYEEELKAFHAVVNSLYLHRDHS